MTFPFYLAKRYLIAKKSVKTVSFIMWVSIIALTVATAAMILFLSIFSGLEELNIKYISNVNPELKILPKQGKLITNLPAIENNLKANQEIAYYSRVIEEKVYITYNDKNEVAYLKAVDDNFTKVTPIDTMVQFGKYPSFIYSNEMIISGDLNNRLALPISDSDYALVYLPKPGEGIITSEENAFNKKEVYSTGVFYINDNYSNYIFAPIDLATELLHLPKNSAYEIEIKLKNINYLPKVQTKLTEKFGKTHKILNRQQQDASFLKMMNIEKLIIYLIFLLVILITSFTLAGAIIIIILDKKKQSKSLLSLGMEKKQLRQSFFLVGVMITTISAFSGLLLGTLITLSQKYFNIVHANPVTPFPVSLETENFMIVFITVYLIGITVSFLASRKIAL